MDMRSVILFGESHPMLAETLSNGTLVVAVLSFIFFVIVAWCKKGARSAFHLATVGAVSTLSTYGICDLIKRAHPVPRPFVALGMNPAFPEPDTMTSFPSAHSAIVAAIVTILLLEWHHRRDTERAVVSGFLIALIPLVWTGRVIAGHHYPIDVVTGSLIGTLVSYVSYRGIERWRN